MVTAYYTLLHMQAVHHHIVNNKEQAPLAVSKVVDFSICLPYVIISLGAATYLHHEFLFNEIVIFLLLG